MKGLRVTPQQRFDALRNELETRIFVQTKLEAIRYNPIVSELLFFNYFSQVNTTYAADNVGTLYAEPDSISHAISELKLIIDDISHLQSVQQAVSQSFSDSPALSGHAAELLGCVDEIRRISEYLVDELLRFPYANLYIYQIAQEVDSYQGALDLLAYARFAYQAPGVAQQIMAAGDHPGGALLLYVASRVSEDVQFQRLGIQVQYQSSQAKLVQELRAELVKALFQFTAFEETSAIYCDTECPQLAVHEMLKKINTARVILSRKCHSDTKITDFFASIDAKVEQILLKSEFVDENFISADMIPKNAKISLTEYLFLLAQSIRLAVEDQTSFFDNLEADLQVAFSQLLNQIYQYALQQQAKAFIRKQQIKLDFSQFVDKSDNLLANLAIPMDIPELSERYVNSAVFLRLLCTRLFYLLQNAFYFNYALGFKKRYAARVASFADFTLDPNARYTGVDIRQLVKRAFCCFLELVRCFCAVDPELALEQGVIEFYQTALPLFALHYVYSFAQRARRPAKLDIETLFAGDRICALAAELPIHAMFVFFNQLRLDQVISITSVSRRAKTVLDIHYLIFDDFYRYYVDFVVVEQLYANVSRERLFSIAPQSQRLCVESAWERISAQLERLVAHSQEGRTRYKMIYESIVCMLVNYVLEYESGKFANLYSYYLAKRIELFETNISDLEVHQRLQQLEDYKAYYRRLSRGRLQDRLVNYRLILLTLDDFYEVLYIKKFFDKLVSQFKDIKELHMGRLNNTIIIIAEFRLQLYYNMFRIKQAMGSTTGHCTLMYDLYCCLVFFKNYIDVPLLFCDVFNQVFVSEQLSAPQACELFDIVKVLNAYVGGLEGVIRILTQRM